MTKKTPQKDKSMQRSMLLIVVVACLPAFIMLGLLAVRRLGSVQFEDRLIGVGLIMAIVLMACEIWVFRWRIWARLPAWVLRERRSIFFGFIIFAMYSLSELESEMTYWQRLWAWASDFAVYLVALAMVLVGIELAGRHLRRMKR